MKNILIAVLSFSVIFSASVLFCEEEKTKEHDSIRLWKAAYKTLTALDTEEVYISATLLNEKYFELSNSARSVENGLTKIQTEENLKRDLSVYDFDNYIYFQIYVKSNEEYQPPIKGFYKMVKLIDEFGNMYGCSGYRQYAEPSKDRLVGEETFTLFFKNIKEDETRIINPKTRFIKLQIKNFGFVSERNYSWNFPIKYPSIADLDAIEFARGKVTCPKCSLLMEPAWKFCPFDGTKLESPEGAK